MGAGLRLYELPHQVVVDDEWHALHHLLRFDYSGILTRFSESDHSMPLTLVYRILADTIGLSELGLRAPSLLAGLAGLVFLPLLWPRDVRDDERVTFAWLLAVSPLHIFFSRYARPYAITLFLSVVAVLAFYRWWRGGSRHWAFLFVGCAIVAPYFSLACAPSFVAPLVFAVFDCAVRRASRRPLRDLFPLVTGMAVGGLPLAIVLGAGPAPVISKLLAAPLRPETLRGVGEFVCGTRHLPLILGVLTCVAVGSRRLWLRNPNLVLYLACVVAGQVGGVLLLRPVGLEYGIVFARYCLPVLPILLLFVGLGARQLDDLATRIVGHARLPPVSVALLGSLLVFGPLPGMYYWPNNFTNHGSLQFDYDNRDYFERFRPPAIPEFYALLSRDAPGAWRLLEAPWHFYWHSYAYYQRLHHQWVAIGFVDSDDVEVRDGELPRGRAGLHFQHFVHVADYDALRARSIDYVVFHRDLITEMAIPFPSRPIQVQGWIAAYQDRFGLPAYEDAYLTVFAVSPAARVTTRRTRRMDGVHGLPAAGERHAVSRPFVYRGHTVRTR